MSNSEHIKKIKCGNSDCSYPLIVDLRKVPRDKPYMKCRKCGTISKILFPVNNDTVYATEKEEKRKPHKNVGWLVVHDENTTKQTFPVKAGTNVIGRYDEEKPCDIMIKTGDKYMSRNHCKLEAQIDKLGEILFYLSDFGSLNGTYINGKEDRVKLKEEEVFILNDDDTLQLGKTKVVIKSIRTSKNSFEAEKNVSKKPYGKTVIL